jgi:Flp pilus assembly protein CpaB
MSRRRIGVLLIIVVLIVVLIGVGSLMLLGSAGLGIGAPAEQEAAVGGTPAPTALPGVPIVIARADGQGIRRGREIREEDLDITFWPVQYLPPEPLSETEQVVGQIARTDIFPGQPVLGYMLFDREDPTTEVAQVGSNAALVIPQNYVAIAFPLTRLSSVAYGIREGDHVDVLMSFRFVDVDPDYQSMLPNEGTAVWLDPETRTPIYGESGIVGRVEDGALGTSIITVPSEPQRPRQTTQAVIFDAVVLRVGTFPVEEEMGVIMVEEAPPTEEPPAEAGGEEMVEPTPIPALIPDIVTLMMPRQDALVLKYAMETGADIDLVLRSVYDNGVDFRGTTEPVTLEYLVRNYNVPVPDTLGYAQQPRIDSYVQEGDFFVPRGGDMTTVETPAEY